MVSLSSDTFIARATLEIWQDGRRGTEWRRDVCPRIWRKSAKKKGKRDEKLGGVKVCARIKFGRM